MRELLHRTGEDTAPTLDEIELLAAFPLERTAHLSEVQQAQLDAMLMRLVRTGVFSFDGRIGRSKTARHHIDVGDAKPFSAKLRRYSIKELEVLWKEVDMLIKLNVIEPANSPWNAPLLLVPKPDGKLRVVQDLRAVNRAVLEHGSGADGYPLPRADEMHQAVDQAVWFSIGDALAGFWQVELDEESRPATAFRTRWGQYQWRVGPMGLMRMPATFQRMMELAVGHDALWVFALVYIDDVLIYSRTFEEHLEHVELVFSRLAASGIKMKPSKCHFAQQQVKFLGHIIHQGGREVDPGKVAAIAKVPLPASITEVRSFLAMASYYRQYIPHFSDRSEPLNNLLRKDVPFVIDDDVIAAWDLLKESLMTAPVLAHPDYAGISAGTTKLVLQTDASDTGLGAVLSQCKGGVEQPLAYYSRSLHGAERNYATYDREALAVVESVLHFRPLLHCGHSFKLETDHAALKYLLNPTNELRTKRQERYVMVLQEYPMEIVFRPGAVNGNADALSRLVGGVWEDAEEPVVRGQPTFTAAAAGSTAARVHAAAAAAPVSAAAAAAAQQPAAAREHAAAAAAAQASATARAPATAAAAPASAAAAAAAAQHPRRCARTQQQQQRRRQQQQRQLLSTPRRRACTQQQQQHRRQQQQQLLLLSNPQQRASTQQQQQQRRRQQQRARPQQQQQRRRQQQQQQQLLSTPRRCARTQQQQRRRQQQQRQQQQLLSNPQQRRQQQQQHQRRLLSNGRRRARAQRHQQQRLHQQQRQPLLSSTCRPLEYTPHRRSRLSTTLGCRTGGGWRTGEGEVAAATLRHSRRSRNLVGALGARTTTSSTPPLAC